MTKEEIEQLIIDAKYQQKGFHRVAGKMSQQLIEALEQVKNIAYEPVLATVKCDCCEKDLTNDSRLCMKCAMTEFK